MTFPFNNLILQMLKMPNFSLIFCDFSVNYILRILNYENSQNKYQVLQAYYSSKNHL